MRILLNLTNILILQQIIQDIKKNKLTIFELDKAELLGRSGK